MTNGSSAVAFKTLAVALLATGASAIIFPGQPGLAVTVLIAATLLGPRVLTRASLAKGTPTRREGRGPLDAPRADGTTRGKDGPDPG